MTDIKKEEPDPRVVKMRTVMALYREVTYSLVSFMFTTVFALIAIAFIVRWGIAMVVSVWKHFPVIF